MVVDLASDTNGVLILLVVDTTLIGLGALVDLNFNEGLVFLFRKDGLVGLKRFKKGRRLLVKVGLLVVVLPSGAAVVALLVLIPPSSLALSSVTAISSWLVVALKGVPLSRLSRFLRLEVVVVLLTGVLVTLLMLTPACSSKLASVAGELSCLVVALRDVLLNRLSRFLRLELLVIDGALDASVVEGMLLLIPTCCWSRLSVVISPSLVALKVLLNLLRRVLVGCSDLSVVSMACLLLLRKGFLLENKFLKLEVLSLNLL